MDSIEENIPPEMLDSDAPVVRGTPVLLEVAENVTVI